MRRHLLAVFSILALLAVGQTQQSSQTPSPIVTVPKLIRFSGQLENNAAGTVGITFTLHKGQHDSDSLWIETQNVKLDSSGKYTVLLGATKADGVPMDLFTSGEAQWLGIRIEGQPEQRVLLVSVPYAMKAAEAETLAGHSAAEFVTSDKLAVAVRQEVKQQATGIAGSKDATTKAKDNVVNSGATNFSASTSNQVVLVTQSGTGSALIANTTSANGVLGTATTTSGYGVTGSNSAASGAAIGVRGTTVADNGISVYGSASGTAGSATGVKGITAAPAGYGVFGQNTSTTGPAVGFRGTTASTSGIGIYGTATAATGASIGLRVSVASPSGTAAVLQNTGSGKLISAQSSLSNTEVFGVDGSGGLTASGGAYITNSTAGSTGLRTSGGANSASGGSGGYGIIGYGGNATSGSGGYGGEFGGGSGSDGASGIYAIGGGGTGASGYGGDGGTFFAGTSSYSASGEGVYAQGGSSNPSDNHSSAGYAFNGYGGQANGLSLEGLGGGGGVGGTGGGSSHPGGHGGAGAYLTGGSVSAATGSNSAGPGVIAQGGYATAGTAGDGIDAYPGTGTYKGYAGNFHGDINVDGKILAGTKDFKIDHPLDPANKYLYHASVESSEMINVYSGNVTTDATGEAIVHLPKWFEAVNGDFRYQLTPIGQFAQVIVATEISNAQFRIKTDKPNVKVSWQVTGVRHDAFAKANPLNVEEDKPEQERGYYIHPEYYGASNEKQIENARHPNRNVMAPRPRRDPQQHPVPANLAVTKSE
ncbi:hypothetical protein Acid345_2109 [Candidatus Koribacter versatilis Ellin345]|uniref:Uncharacterized protein n=1 Tax=Koribacter versatilis (strain Ellin345) TaxID=204669 RepID=Q1IPU0_KORVE|nr:hypothetical protein [Candidatus Koribacter versatilis]ABF41110.1 hypothetical protein Acid345_2109 [Candidatus Koribacter versatilis Ellin345]